MPSVQTFIDRVKAVCVSTTGVLRTIESSGIPVAPLTAIPRFPTCIVNDAGGQLHRASSKLEKMWIDVTVLDISSRDSWGDVAIQRIRTIGEAIKTSLEHDKTNTIHLASSTANQPIDVAGYAHLIVYKTWRFEALIDRTA